MITLSKLIIPELTVYIETEDFNKKKSLDKISRLASDWDSEVKYQTILEALQKREKIGNTAVGHGIAIPHARIANLRKPLIVILSLANSINFSLHESIMVKLIVGLLVPKNNTDEHLEILAKLSEKLNDEQYRDLLHQATNSHELYHAAETL